MRKIILLLAALALILCGCGGAPEETTVPETEPDGTGLFTYREPVTQYPTCYSPLDWYTALSAVGRQRMRCALLPQPAP